MPGLGVLLTIVAMAVSGSAGVAAERRWPTDAVRWARSALVVLALHADPVSSSSSTLRESIWTPTSREGW